MLGQTRPWLVTLVLSSGVFSLACARSTVHEATPEPQPRVSPVTVAKEEAAVVPEVRPSEDELSLPEVEAPVQNVGQALEVRVSRKALRVDGAELVELPPLSEQATLGVGRERRGNLLIVALAESVKRREPATSDAALFIDRETPFRVLVEVLFTLGQTGMRRVVLATGPRDRATGTVTGFDFGPDTVKRDGAFVVFVIGDGFAVKDNRSNVAPGCAGLGAGVTLPRSDGAYDFAGLTRCMKSRRESPAARTPRATIRWGSSRRTPALATTTSCAPSLPCAPRGSSPSASRSRREPRAD